MTVRVKKPQRPDDIVIHSAGADAYVISNLRGDSIGTSHDRREAMRRACAAAAATGAHVWICVENSQETYHEVLCP